MPVRWRLTLAFACVMAVLLVASGVFVRQQVGANLDTALNASLRSHAADIATLAQQADTGLADATNTGVAGQRAQLAQIIDARGRVIDATPGLPPRPLLGTAALARAQHATVLLQRTVVAGDQPVRLLAVPIRAQGKQLVAVVGQSLEQRQQAIGDLKHVLLIGGPVTLLLASLAGYALIGSALRPVEIMRRRERTFIADASHELRSPLAMLQTELELMARDQPSGDDLRAATDSAIEETTRLARLADDLLLLTRADSHRLELRARPVALADLVRAATGRALRRKPAGVEIAIRGAAGAPLVRADPDRIGQALDNMLGNALRYAAGAIEVNARVAGSTVEIHVMDDGPGFPADFLPRAWERFARADSARTDGGAGLGLPIICTIAELHGGEAGAVNRPGGGADVWISLPLLARPRVAARVPGRPAGAPGA
jgi:signal transduction histidine kinase